MSDPGGRAKRRGRGGSTARASLRRERRRAKARRRARTRAAGPETPPSKRGGRRKGAGRKPKGERAGVSHRTRPGILPTRPVHVTTRVMIDLPSLRQTGPRQVLERSLSIACERFGMRIVHYTIQSNHLHLIVEVRDRFALSKGMQGLLVRFAKNLNKHWDRHGRVFADRYYARELTSLREVRNALLYVLRNCDHHHVRVDGLDEYSSARWFDGWKDPPGPGPGPRARITCVPARGWMLRVGWKQRYGPIGLDELPRLAGDTERHTKPTPRAVRAR
jgi:REP element-mobilizing transposase RayT